MILYEYFFCWQSKRKVDTPAKKYLANHRKVDTPTKKHLANHRKVDTPAKKHLANHPISAIWCLINRRIHRYGRPYNRQDILRVLGQPASNQL